MLLDAPIRQTEEFYLHGFLSKLIILNPTGWEKASSSASILVAELPQSVRPQMEKFNQKFGSRNILKQMKFVWAEPCESNAGYRGYIWISEGESNAYQCL